MTGARLGGLLWFLLGSAIFVLLGVAWERHSALSMVDFKSVYYGARCLLEGSDPYQEGELLRVYQAEGGDRPTDPAVHRLVVPLPPVQDRLARDYSGISIRYSRGGAAAHL